MNLAVSYLPKKPIILSGSTASPFQSVGNDPTLYRKELIYPSDKFAKRNQDDGSIDFTLPVTEATLDHWASQFAKMKAAGVEVPLVVEHTEDPEERRGTVVDIRKEYNPQRGMPSLFMYGRFRDPEAAELAKTSQVSLYAKPKFYDGVGNEYEYPITHVAMTDYPLIPALGGWEIVPEKGQSAASNKVIAASLVLSDAAEPTQDQSMNPMQALAQEMGIAFPPGADDETIKSLIMQAWDAEAPAEEGFESPEEEGLEDPMMTDEMGGDDMLGDDGMGDADPSLDDPSLEEDPLVAPAGASIAASLGPAVKATVDARRMQLEALVVARKITPAERDHYVKTLANPGRVKFALSSGGVGDGFSDIVASLNARGASYPAGEKTPVQHGDGGSVPAIVRDAERRRKASG